MKVLQSYTIYIVHTVVTAKVIKHPLPLEISIDLACAITIHMKSTNSHGRTIIML